jgi:2-oxoisovalerate dehydrogenase E2 component (dihydrolipoyl transacylase)
LRLVRGTGPAGRMLHEDLDAYWPRQSNASAPRSRRYAQRNDEEQIPVIGMRRKIAQRMQDATARRALQLRRRNRRHRPRRAARAPQRKHGASRGKLTLLPFLVRAMVVALRDFPQINARYDDEAQVITRLGAVHVGVATQRRGLMVPVLRHAEARSLWDSAAEIARWPRPPAMARPAATNCPARPSP